MTGPATSSNAEVTNVSDASEVSAAEVVRAAQAILKKDLTVEVRSRVAVNSLLLFAVCCLALVAFALGPTRLSPEDREPVGAVLLWIVLFFSAMTGLSRAFVKEEESGTAAALKLTCPPAAVFLGKLAANSLLLGIVSVAVVPLFLVLMGLTPAGPGLFVTLLVLGLLGLASASTFAAAIVAKASSKGALFAVLTIPVLLPLLIPAVMGTTMALRSADVAVAGDVLKTLVAFDGVLTVAGFLLFDFVWRD